VDQAVLVVARAAGCALAILAGAKAHGRQVRLEREREGVWTVDFRRPNPPAVEAIWRRDRRLFWPTFVVLGATGATTAILRATQPTEGAAWVAYSLAMSFAAAFTVAGLASAARLVARNKQPPPPDPDWWRAGHRGSIMWWSLDATALLLGAVTAFLG
jgi:hypothetical protein